MGQNNNIRDRELSEPRSPTWETEELLELSEVYRKRERQELEYSARNLRKSVRWAIDAYLSGRRNINTKAAHKNDLIQFSEHLSKNGILKLKDMGVLTSFQLKALCEGWLDSLLEKGNSKITVQRKKGTIKAFLTFLHNELPRIISFVPALDNEKHKEYYTRAKTAALTQEEWKRFSNYLSGNPKTYKLFVMLQSAMLLGGRRIGEILKLKWSEIDFFQKCVYIIPSKKREDVTTYILPLSPQLELILKNYRKTQNFKLTKDDLVFPNETQQRIDSKLKYYSKKIGITKKICFHSVRTSFVTWANEQGHTQSEILNATLHNSTRMIRYYDKTESLQVNSILRLNL